MIIKIDPVDTLFFRDGKPFTMGEDTWASGIFPPHPSVIYGALRSAYFSKNIGDLDKANRDGDRDPTRKLRIKGLYLWDDNNVYLPQPNDCVQKKEDRGNVVSVLSMSVLRDLKCSCPTKYVPKSNEQVENISGGLISICSFKEYLGCTNDVFSFIKMADRVLPEPKIGIGIDKVTGTSEEGKLYRVGMNRLDKLSLLVDFEGMDLDKRGMIKLGGEGKAAAYQIFEPIDMSIGNFESDKNLFKLYLSTPAIFKKGWIPDWINEKNLIGAFKGLKMELLTASLGKTIYIGGFDIKKRMPKPMYKAVPAGSVYYFKLIEGDNQKACDLLNQTAISDLYPEQGFGIAYVGGIHKNV